MPDETQGLTERQKAWFASVRASFERETGRPFEAWVPIARTCPETRPRARLAWFKREHGLGQNRASIVLQEVFGAERALAVEGLWSDPASAAILAAVEAASAELEGVVVARRKGFTAFSRTVQFAAARPLKGGGLRLGLAVPAGAASGLQARGSESWSERLTAKLDLSSSAERAAEVAGLLRAAWERS